MGYELFVNKNVWVFFLSKVEYYKKFWRFFLFFVLIIIFYRFLWIYIIYFVFNIFLYIGVFIIKYIYKKY